jgi:ABC-type phosphate transport system substrate-binding protein
MRAQRLTFMLFITAVSFFATAGSTLALDEIVVIVSPENKIDQISMEDLKRIYLKERKDWGNGLQIAPIDLGESDPVRHRFIQVVLKRSVVNMKYYWIEQIFSGKGTPPLAFRDDKEVKAYVASNPEAIGYIRAKNLDETVKAIHIEGKTTLP